MKRLANTLVTAVVVGASLATAAGIAFIVVGGFTWLAWRSSCMFGAGC